MQSSREGNLGLKSTSRFSWKGQTLAQISSVIKKNERPEYTNKLFYFKALPNKGYRRELVANTNTNTRYPSKSSNIQVMMDLPGSTIVNGGCSTTADNCNGFPTTLEVSYQNDSKASSCNPCSNSFVQNNTQDNARRRVRSSGITKPRYDNNKANVRMVSYMSSSQYLHSRNKTFSQNQFNNIRSGDSTRTAGSANTVMNEYASNTIQHCDGDNLKTNFVPIYYKPNNAKFATQGSVDSSARLLRLKYDTIIDSANTMKESHGLHTSSALAYGVPANGYTIKDKIGYPNTCSPKFPKGYVCKG